MVVGCHPWRRVISDGVASAVAHAGVVTAAARSVGRSEP